jgi:hypothetical protein
LERGFATVEDTLIKIDIDAQRQRAVGSIAWLDAFESIVSLCMAKAKLVWKNLDDLPNLR